MLQLEEIKSAVSKVGKKYGIKNAYLFGSYAKGSANDSSDVDIIIDDNGNIRTLLQLSTFGLELSDELHTKVDVLTSDSVNPHFFNLIKKDRIILYGA